MCSSAAVDMVKRETLDEPPDAERGGSDEGELTLDENEDPQSWKASKKCTHSPA